MSGIDHASRISHFGVVLGPVPAQPYNATRPDQFMTDINPVDLLGCANNLKVLRGINEVQDGALVRHGEQSRYYLSSTHYGAFMKWHGYGHGDLFAIEGSATRHVGRLYHGSWAFIPQNLYFYFSLADGVPGSLTPQYLGATLYRSATA